MREREKKRNHYANSKTCLFYDARPFVLNVKASILPLGSVFDNPSLSQKNRQSSGYLHVDLQMFQDWPLSSTCFISGPFCI